MSSPAATAAQRYVEAVNAADIDRLLALFAPDGVVRNPTGVYARHDQIREFYEGIVFAGQARITTLRLVGEGDVAMMQISATSPLASDGEGKEAADVFITGADGRIAQLTVYYL